MCVCVWEKVWHCLRLLLVTLWWYSVFLAQNIQRTPRRGKTFSPSHFTPPTFYSSLSPPSCFLILPLHTFICSELSFRLSSLFLASSIIWAFLLFSSCSLCFRLATFFDWSFICLYRHRKIQNKPTVTTLKKNRLKIEMRFVIWALYNTSVDFKSTNQYAESTELQL